MLLYSSMLMILSCLMHSAMPLYPLPEYDLNTALLIWMPGFVSTVCVLTLANSRLYCLVHFSVYCHFLLSPVAHCLLSSNSHWSDHNPWHHYWQTFHLWFWCFCTLSEIFLHLWAPRHICSFLTEDMAASIASTNGSIPPRLLQLTPFWLFSLQRSKTPTHSKYCCPDCSEHITTVPIPAVAPELALTTCLLRYQD